uniref:Potassium channel domain-containing protein n=1 Tax=Acrobeloides nanus TaxID=290746 RepID=A0A914D8M8_9BILA
MIIIVILYTIIGAYFIRNLEATKLNSITIRNLTEENDSNIYNQSKTEVEIFEYWTTQDAVLFAFSIITTIGYGNVAPVTPQGRLFVLFYGLFDEVNIIIRLMKQYVKKIILQNVHSLS